MTVALGIDVGERRIGVARSDGWGLLATPLTTVLRTSDHAAVGDIARLAGEAGASLLVVGLPLDERGEMTAQAHRSVAFARKLQTLPDVQVLFWNERHSSAEAARRLRATASPAAPGETDVSQARRGRRPPPSRRRREEQRRQEDAAAAAVILQEFLDQQRQPGNQTAAGAGAGAQPGAQPTERS
jgi:putative Holliday junction resolvase